MGLIPLSLGELAQKSGFWPIFSMKTALYRLFEFEARGPKEEHRGRQPLVGYRVVPYVPYDHWLRSIYWLLLLGLGQDG